MADERQFDEERGTPPDAVGRAPVPSPPRRSQVSDGAGQAGPEAEIRASAGDDREGRVGDLVPAGHLELVERGAGDVTVGSLSITQGGVNTARADTIDIRQGGISRADGRSITVMQGGIAIARGERVSVGMGAIGAALGGEVSVRQGFARSVLARDVRIEQGGARTVIANQVRFDRTSGALVVIAARAEGNIRTLLDWRGALAFGVAFGLIAGLARRVRR